MSRIINGGRSAAFYPFTNGTSPTVTPTAAITLGDQISTDISADDATGAWTATIDNIQDDATLNTFLEAYKDYALAGLESLTMEDGTTLAATSSKAGILVVKGGLVIDGSASPARKVAAFPCVLNLSSGSWKQEGKKYNHVKISVKGLAMEGTLTMPTAMFTNFMTTATQQTIGTSNPYGRVFFN